MPDKWTFQIPVIADFISKYLFKAKNVLFPFAGQTRYPAHPSIDYIDIDPTVPKPVIVGNTLDILPQLVQQNKKYDLIISDPPFTFCQCLRRYKNKDFQEISICKKYYDDLLNADGRIIHFGFNSTGMGLKRGYKKEVLFVVNHGGSHNDLLILVERKMVQTLGEECWKL
jgi:hypothetical protein